MRKRLTVAGLALALAGGALIAGCGGGNDNDPKADYIKKADEICALGTFKIGTASQKRFGNTQPPANEQAKFAKQVVVPTLQTEVLNKLRGLTPPPGDEQQVKAIWDALQASINQLRANPDLLAQPNAGGAFDQPNSLAHDYGFKQCGSG